MQPSITPAVSALSRWPYYVVTVVLALFIALGAVIDVLKTPDAVAFMTHLGYPEYFIRFIGVAKLLGVVAVLLPGWPRLKEWAYAGLFFDTTGALYSGIANGDAPAAWVPALVGMGLTLASYVLFRRYTSPPAPASPPRA